MNGNVSQLQSIQLEQGEWVNEMVIGNKLLVISISKPQVVTETIYCLHKQGIKITELHVITTEEGLKEIKRSLMSSANNRLTQLCEDYNLPRLSFGEEQIYLLKNASGELITDANRQQVQPEIADAIFNIVRDLTSDSKSRLHASIAGGRKTLSYYLGMAMTVFARPEDTLNYVSIDKNYENSDFFYPTPYEKYIYANGESLNTQDANVQLLAVPFMQLRESLPTKVLKGQYSYQQTLESCKTITSRVQLVLDIVNTSLICSNKAVKLSRADFAFYWMVIENLIADGNGFTCPPKAMADETLAMAYLNKRHELAGEKNIFTEWKDAYRYAIGRIDYVISERELKPLLNGMTAAFFEQRKSSINRKLDEHLGPTIAEHYNIDVVSNFKRDGAKRPVSRFSIHLPKNLIKFRI